MAVSVPQRRRWTVRLMKRIPGILLILGIALVVIAVLFVIMYGIGIHHHHSHTSHGVSMVVGLAW